MAERDATVAVGVERPTTIERAFELARSGRCSNVADIAATLKRERHEAVDAHLAGPSIRQSLRTTCEAARKTRMAPQDGE